MAIQIQHRSLAAVLSLLCFSDYTLRAQQLSSAHHVPVGFMLEKIAGEPELRFPMFAAFDERGRLFVTEASGGDLYEELKAQTRYCRVRLLEDRDGDGRFETSRVFARDLVFPMGVVWGHNKLFVADPPDLVAFEDSDGDGQADRREVIVTGFGHTDNGSLHGLTFGPDGFLYMTTGEPDGYRIRLPDGAVLEGESGALIRCRPDGSRLEVLCRGFENLVEIVFTPRGEIIGTDNWYQKPQRGLRDALLHLVEGGLYPMHADKGTPQPITGAPLPAITLFPAVALSGLELYRGLAFPPDMRGNLFSAQHNSRKVMRHVLVQNGSTFRTRDEDFVTSDDPDFHPSDVLEDADGSLLVVDTGSWYVHHCPTGRIRKSPATGGIYRVRRIGSARLKDPWGIEISWANVSSARLAAMLSDERPVVRDRATHELSSRGNSTLGELVGFLNGTVATDAKQAAVWALAGIGTTDASSALESALSSIDPEVAVTAARALVLRRDKVAAAVLGRMLEQPTPFVRIAAAEALAHCGSRKSLPQIWRALDAAQDRVLEHSLVYAAHRVADLEALIAALGDPSFRVQSAALLLLSQPPSPPDALEPDWVLKRVTASDSDLRQTALGILQRRTNWAPHAAIIIQRWLRQTDLSSEQQRALPDLLKVFGITTSVQEIISDALLGAAAPVQTRLLMYMTEAGVPPLKDSSTNALKRLLLISTNRELQSEAVRLAGSLRLDGFENQLAKAAADESQPPETRLRTIQALIRRRPELDAGTFRFLIAELSDQNEPLRAIAAAAVLRHADLSDTQVLQAVRAVRGTRLIPLSTLISAWRKATSDAETGELLATLAQSVQEGAKLRESDLQNALKRFPPRTQEKAASLRRLLRDTGDAWAKLARYEPLLSGGNAERGRAVFRNGRAGCVACHTIGNEGGQIGPDLTSIGATRSGDDLLEAILIPSSTFAQGYEPYTVVTSGGDEISGILIEQTAEAISTRDVGGAEARLARKSIRELRREEVSLMPEGLETGLTEAEFRDLLAFLQSLR
jgi:putative membrane-bound dehydrogenase-like protein